MNLKLNVRHLELLELLPVAPKFLTVNQLVAKLATQHHYKDHSEASLKRNLQRDLKQLESYSITQSGDSPEGLKWSLVKDSMYLTAQLSPADALCFVIIQRFIQPVFPNVLSPYLNRVFEKSAEILNNLNYHNQLTTWLDKIYIEHKGQPLIPASIDEAVRSNVYDALLIEKLITIKYRKKNGEFSSATVAPLGMVIRSHIQYLVVQYQGYSDIRMLAMNRINFCEVSNDIFDYPISFNLKEYVEQGKAGFVYKNTPDDFEAIFSDFAADLIAETPLSENQTTSIYPTESGHKILVKAKLPMNYDIETWLLGLGPYVEVVKPVKLRETIKEKLIAAAALYD